MTLTWTNLPHDDTERDHIPAALLAEVLLENRYEVRRWCQRFICTEAQLRLAVAQVGNDPQAVRVALHR
jgi:hypothetical protein